MDESQQLPNATDAEKSVLSLMMQGDAVHHLELAEERGLTAEEFYVPAHGALFRTLNSMRLAGKPVELVGLTQELRDNGTLENVGGRGAVVEIYTFQPAAAHFDHHLELVKAKATQRSALALLNEKVAALFNCESSSVDATLAKTIADLQGIADKSQQRSDEDLDAKKALEEVVQEIKDRVDGKPAPIVETPIDNLNAAIGGGLGIGEITFIAARPSQGKTSLALNVLQHAAKREIPCHFVSIESAAVRLTSRMVSAEAGFPTNSIRKGEAKQSHLDSVKRAIRCLRGKPFWMRKLHNATALDVARVIRRRHRQSGTKLVVIDYLQLLKPCNAAERSDKRLCIDNALDVLCPLADQLGIALVILAQLSRPADGVPGRDLKLSSLKESSRIEQDADLALLIGDAHDHEANNEEQEPKVINIPKNRDGETTFARVQFHKPTTTFSQY